MTASTELKYDMARCCLSGFEQILREDRHGWSADEIANARAAIEAHVADLAAKIARLEREAAEAAGILEECLEYFEAREDVEDGSYGEPEANPEMRLAMRIRREDRP